MTSIKQYGSIALGENKTEQEVPNRNVLDPKSSWTQSLYMHRRVMAATFVVALGSMAAGTMIGYSSPAMPDLNSRTPAPFRTTPDQTSWVSSVTLLGSMVGSMLGGAVADSIGRQQTLVVGIVPFFIGWVVVACSSSFTVMMVGRTMTGLFKGLTMSTVSVYITEIAPKHIRGKLGAFQDAFFNLGILYTYILGDFLPWNWLAIACGAILVLMEILLVFLPETPRWLAAHNQTERGENILRWFRCSSNVSAEFSSIQKSLRGNNVTPYLDFLRGPLLRPLIISQGLTIFQQLSGANFIKSYTVEIFTDAGTDMDANIETIIIGTISVCGSIASAFLVEIVGRRILYMVSTLFMGLSMMTVGVFFYIQSTDPSRADGSLGWMPLTSLVVFNFAFSLASGSLLYCITCEIFPTEARQRANSFAVFTQALAGFLLTKFFVDLENVIHDYGAFFLCSGISFAGLIFVIFMMPETTGKSLEELHHDGQNKPTTPPPPIEVLGEMTISNDATKVDRTLPEFSTYQSPPV